MSYVLPERGLTMQLTGGVGRGLCSKSFRPRGVTVEQVQHFGLQDEKMSEDGWW